LTDCSVGFRPRPHQDRIGRQMRQIGAVDFLKAHAGPKLLAMTEAHLPEHRERLSAHGNAIDVQEAAHCAGVCPHESSFKRTLRMWSNWPSSAEPHKLCRLIAQRPVRNRPGRNEPRPRRRRPKSFPSPKVPRAVARRKIRNRRHPLCANIAVIIARSVRSTPRSSSRPRTPAVPPSPMANLRIVHLQGHQDRAPYSMAHIPKLPKLAAS